MTDPVVDPAVGLPSGRPLLGSVGDGIRLPYQLDLGGRPSARLVLRLDGVVASDAAGGPSGVITVPPGQAALQLSDHVQVVLTASDPSTGATLATASTSARVSGGAQLPATLTVVDGPQTGLRAGESHDTAPGAAVTFQTVVGSGAEGIRLTGYDLTVDGVSILTDPRPASLGSQQWISGRWTAPTTPGRHTLVLSASVEGTSQVQSATYSLGVAPTGAMTWVTQPGDIDLATGSSLVGVLKVASTYAPVVGATVDISWVPDSGGTWGTVGTAVTDGAGQFSLRVTPAVTGRFIAHTAGVRDVVGDTTSGTLAIGVRPRILLAASSTVGTAGQPIALTVSAPAPMAGALAMVQLWNGVCWCTVGSQALSAQGTASFSYAPPLSGTYRFGAMTSYADTYAPTASDDVTVTVR